MDRITYLKELLLDEPGEPFLHYALCLERKKAGEDVLADFVEMIRTFPDYLPAYYQTALYQAESGFTDEAADIAFRGIALAEKLADQHAMAEIKGLRQNILAGEYD